MYIQHTKNALTTLLLVLLVLSVACKNNTKNADETADSATDPLENMAGEEISEEQHNFPPEPLEIKTDTAFKIDDKEYGYKSTQKTIDTSMVVFVHKAMGKTVKDVYLDFVYTLKPTGEDYSGGEFTISKHTFKNEFTKEYINHSILHKMEFLGFNEYNKEYEYKFVITQPDTDYSYIIYYFINNKGETKFHIDDA